MPHILSFFVPDTQAEKAYMSLHFHGFQIHTFTIMDQQYLKEMLVIIVADMCFAVSLMAFAPVVDACRLISLNNIVKQLFI